MPSLKRMSMGPKKKYEYFDGGRGIDLKERCLGDEKPSKLPADYRTQPQPPPPTHHQHTPPPPHTTQQHTTPTSPATQHQHTPPPPPPTTPQQQHTTPPPLTPLPSSTQHTPPPPPTQHTPPLLHPSDQRPISLGSHPPRPPLIHLYDPPQQQQLQHHHHHHHHHNSSSSSLLHHQHHHQHHHSSSTHHQHPSFPSSIHPPPPHHHLSEHLSGTTLVHHPLPHHHQQHHLSEIMVDTPFTFSGGGVSQDCGRYTNSVSSPVVTSPMASYLSTSTPSSPTSPAKDVTGSPHYPREYHPPGGTNTTSSGSPTGYGGGVDNLLQDFPAVPPPSYSPQGAASDLSLASSPESSKMCSRSFSRDEDGKRAKRKQRCRLCANHDIYAEVKGHKWYCPYRDPHECEKCEITRKRQYYMAEQQKLTREQQQQQQQPGMVGVCLKVPPPLPSEPSGVQNTKPRGINDFPRLEELVKETSNIYSEELFQKINKIVRPRAGQYGRSKSQH